jgi:hypothetical protein
MTDKKKSQLLIALAVFCALLLNFPLIRLFSGPVLIHGIPVLLVFVLVPGY